MNFYIVDHVDRPDHFNIAVRQTNMMTGVDYLIYLSDKQRELSPKVDFIESEVIDVRDFGLTVNMLLDLTVINGDLFHFTVPDNHKELSIVKYKNREPRYWQGQLKEFVWYVPYNLI